MTEEERASTEADVLQKLSALVLYPKREGGNSVRIESGPVVVLCWGREGVEVLVSFQGGRDLRIKVQTVSTGRSLWIRDRTHRLAPAYAVDLARSIVRVMASGRVPQ